MHSYQGIFWAVIAASGFSIKAIFVKLSFIERANANQILFLRMLFALPIYLILVFLYFKKDILMVKEWMSFLVLAFLGYYGSSMLDFHGLEYVSAGLERIILFLYPTMVLVLSILIYKKKPNKFQVISLVIAYLGIVVIFLFRNTDQHKNIFLGSLLVFFACLTYSVFLIYSQRMILKWGSILFTSVTMSLACLLVILHFFIFEKPSFLFMQPTVVQYALLLTIFSTLLPSYALSLAIEKIGSSKTSIIGAIGPVITILLANIILDEPYSNFDLIGSFLVILGVLILSKSK